MTDGLRHETNHAPVPALQATDRRACAPSNFASCGTAARAPHNRKSSEMRRPRSHCQQVVFFSITTRLRRGQLRLGVAI